MSQFPKRGEEQFETEINLVADSSESSEELDQPIEALIHSEPKEEEAN